MIVVAQPNGTIRCLYDEAVDLGALGPLVVARASYVEPDGRGQWWADLTPVHGPLLGGFAKRSDALRAEVAWLERHWLRAA